jgi:hypothetical protein
MFMTDAGIWPTSGRVSQSTTGLELAPLNTAKALLDRRKLPVAIFCEPVDVLRVRLSEEIDGWPLKSGEGKTAMPDWMSMENGSPGITSV